MPLKNEEQRRLVCEQQPTLAVVSRFIPLRNSACACIGALLTPRVSFLPAVKKLLVSLVSRSVGFRWGWLYLWNRGSAWRLALCRVSWVLSAVICSVLGTLRSSSVHTLLDPPVFQAVEKLLIHKSNIIKNCQNFPQAWQIWEGGNSLAVLPLFRNLPLMLSIWLSSSVCSSPGN